MKHPADDLWDEAGGVCLYTFTARLPFVLGIPNDLGHTIASGERYADPEDAAVFGERPFVSIRVFAAEESGLPTWPRGTRVALKHFYDHEVDLDEAERYGEAELVAYDQWITLETPSAPTESEVSRPDPGFAFHRSLQFLNLFLRAVQGATRDIRIRPVTSHDLQPVVIVGAIRPGAPWKLLTVMFMHPEARPDPLPPPEGPVTEAQVNGGIQAVLTQRPYLTTILWRSRAQRALRQTGDPADAIISYQVAAESLVFDTFRMLLVDEGKASAEIEAAVDGEVAFKPVLTKSLPSRLGGSWDVTLAHGALRQYWEDLYLVRNRIVHGGFDPHGGHAQDAEKGYRALRDHLESRLVAKMTDYPRTACARFGREGLSARGLMTKRMSRLIEGFEHEAGPWYWPWDVAGRAK